MPLPISTWDKMIAAVLVAVGILIVLAAFLFLLYSGFFYKLTINFSTSTPLPLRFAYKIVIGPYENIGPEFWKLNNCAPHLTLFGVYYDNPNEAQSDQLRAIVGCCLPEDKEDSCEKSLTEAGYDIETFPKCTKALVTEFPYRNNLSILIAVKRVYPSLMEYIKEHCSEMKNVGPFFEVYKDKVIKFVVVLEPNKGFTVSKLPPPPLPLKTEEVKKAQ